MRKGIYKLTCGEIKNQVGLLVDDPPHPLPELPRTGIRLRGSDVRRAVEMFDTDFSE